MRIESDGYLATRAVEERDDAELGADAQAGDARQETGSEPAAPPAAAEAGVQTLRVMARESDDIVRRFERPLRVVSEPIERESLPARTPAAQAVATLAAQAPAVAAPPAATVPAASGYVGERPVDASWLGEREKALTGIRADYESARAQAQSTQGSGPGWVAAVTVTDESGQVRSANGRALVFVADPNAPQVVAGYDESGPIYRPSGQWMEFDEDAFAAHYRAQGGAQLQSLAALYGTDSTTLFAQHPELWHIATSDHALNAGPPPAGRAMGDPGQLGMLDLYVADPQIAGLIQAYGGQPQPATSDIAREQVRIYGQERYDQLTKLGHAMDSVRQQYSDAMAQAQASGAGPGWVERARTITVTDESGQHATQAVYVTDESGQPLRDTSGQPQAVMERIFDPDAFTAWYEQQGGLQHQAFANFYGASHTTYATDESGRTFASNIAFDNPNWSMYGAGGAMGHKDLIGINPNAPPDLRNREAVGFDLEAGWATAHGNIKEKRDWFETVVQVAMVAVVSYVSAGTLGPAAAGAMGLSTTTVAGAMVSAAVAGAATSVASGMMSGNLTLKGVLQGALAGGLSAGLMTQFGPVVNSALPGGVGTLALRTTVQGGIQALLGGHFKDGAIAGFAGGLADMASANMQANISDAVKNGTMDATQAASARMFARVMGSAIRAMGNPDDPSHAFASAFLTDVMKESGAPVVAPAPVPSPAPAPAPEPEDGSDGTPAPWTGPGPDPNNPNVVTYPIGSGADTGERVVMDRGLYIDGRLVSYESHAPDGATVANYSSPDPGRFTLTLGDSYALVRGQDGGLRFASMDQFDADTMTLVAGPGQNVYSGGGRLVVLPAGASPELLSAAGAMTVAFGQRASLGALADAALAAARGGATTLLEDLTASLPRVLGVVGLLVVPGNVGQNLQTEYLQPDARFITRPGERLGSLEIQVTDDKGSSQWVRLQNQSLDSAQARQLLGSLRTSTLTPEEIERLVAPITTPLPPPAGPGMTILPPLSPEERDRLQRPITTPIHPQDPPFLPGPTIEPLTIDDLIVTSRGYEPGTAEHKAATWDYYRDRGGDWDYDRWSSTYDANQTRASEANAAADRYRDSIGWGGREVTVQVEIDGRTENRRLDIADPELRKAIEYKTGYQTATADNLWELARDAELVKQGWSVQWVFRDRVSAPLEEALRRAGIDVKNGD